MQFACELIAVTDSVVRIAAHAPPHAIFYEGPQESDIGVITAERVLETFALHIESLAGLGA